MAHRDNIVSLFKAGFRRQVPTDKLAHGPSKSMFENLSCLWPYIFKHWKLAALSGILTLLAGLLTFPTPMLMRGFLDKVVIAENPSHFALLLVLILTVTILEKTSDFLRQYTSQLFEQRSTLELRNEMTRRIFDLPKHFFDQTNTGYIMSRLNTDIKKAKWFFSPALMNLAMQVVKLIGGICFLLYLDWRVAAGTMLLLPLFSVASFKFAKRQYVLSLNHSEQRAQTNSKLEESLSNIHFIKSSVSENQATDSIIQQLKGIYHLNMESFSVNAVYQLFVTLLPGLARFTLLVFGAWWIMRDEWTLGSLLASQMYLNYVFAPVKALAYSNITFQNARAALCRVGVFFNLTPEDNLNSGITAAKLTGRIELTAVDFSYEPTQPVLKNISLDISPGETVAVVGPSGAGKTTLAALLMRLYQPAAGDIKFDGVSASEYNLKNLRSHLALVLQSPEIFSGTLLESLRYSAPKATEEEAEKALHLAGLSDFIASLPSGLATRLEEHAGNLSHGQRQRLAIAGALLRSPDILIMDEPASALDGKIEQGIMQTLPKATKDMTVFIISHRLSTIRNADRIVVLDAGSIAGMGTHEELVSSCQCYRELFNLQQQEASS